MTSEVNLQSSSMLGMQLALEQLEKTGEQIAQLSENTQQTDLASDMVKLSESQHSFTANAKVAQTQDEILGTAVNLLI